MGGGCTPPPSKERMKIKKIKNIFQDYGYVTEKGKLYYGVREYNAKKEAYEFLKFGRYIGIEKVSQDMDGGEQVVTIGFDNLQDVRDQIDVDRALLGNKKELQSRLLGRGADVVGPSINTLVMCLHQSEQNAEQGMCFHRTGWIFNKKSDGKGGSYTDQQFKSNALIAKGGNQSTRYVGDYDLCQKGSFAEWKKLIEKRIIGTVPLEVAVLIGLSPIISSGWGARNLIYHYMGDSSKGKTTSASAALSTTGCPNPAETATRKNFKGKQLRSLMSSWRGTANALTAKLDGLDGTLMVFDELSKLEDPKVLTPTIYTISDGADKDRMESPTAMLATNVFRTNILSLGEESLLKKVSAKNTGINMRVCEISGEFTKSSEQSEAIVQGCYENYGHAAPLFAEYIVNNLRYEEVAALREKNLDEYTEALRQAGCPSVALRRLAEFGAILLTVADIAEPALGIKFSREEIKAFLADQQSNSDQNQDIALRAHAALWGFVNTYIANFTTVDDLRGNKFIPCPCYGRIDTAKDGKTKEVSIQIQEFQKIMEKLGFNNADLIIDKLKDHGLLNHEAGKRYRKRTITKEMGSVRVYTIRFPDTPASPCA